MPDRRPTAGAWHASPCATSPQPRWLRQVQADPTRLHDLERAIARLLADPAVAERVRIGLRRRAADGARAEPAADVGHAPPRSGLNAAPAGAHDMLVGWACFLRPDGPGSDCSIAAFPEVEALLR